MLTEHRDVLTPAAVTDKTNGLPAAMTVSSVTGQYVDSSEVNVSSEQVLSAARQFMRPEFVMQWWRRPAPAYGNMTPEEAVQRGQAEQVLEVLSRLEEGLYF